MDMKFFNFGEKKAKEIIVLLFLFGVIPIAFYCIMIGNLYGTMYSQQTSVPSPYGGFTAATESSGLLGLFVGLLSFVVVTLVWKLICELLLIIFRCLEVYIRKNSGDN
jgi:hypothetical protein